MTQGIIIIGIILAALGLVFCAFTTRWKNGWFFHYRITNWRLFGLGMLLLVSGLGLIFAAAYTNGQFN